MNLNYSSLNQPVTKADITAYKQSLGPQKKTPLIVYIIIGFTGFLYILFMIFSNSDSGTEALIQFFGISAIAAIVVALIAWAIRVYNKKLAKLYRFATQNGITFKQSILDPGYAGLVFDEGHSRRVDETYIFPDGSEIGNYQYTTGSGKHRQVHFWSYARIKLTRRLPNMVLDAKQNNFFGKLTNLPDSFNKQQTLSLEGNFNDHFTLYAPQEYGRDALYVFTPDVMAAVIDAGRAYDMEVIDDNLMLYSSGKIKLDSEQELSRIITIMDKIGAELRDQSQHYADERVGDRTQNIIAAPGRRLKSGISVTTILVILGIAAYIILNLFSVL